MSEFVNFLLKITVLIGVCLFIYIGINIIFEVMKKENIADSKCEDRGGFMVQSHCLQEIQTPTPPSPTEK